MWNPVFNLAVHWLKLVYQEKVNPVWVLGLYVHVCASWYGSLWAATDCLWVLHREERRQAGGNKKGADQKAQGMDACWEVTTGRKTPLNFLCSISVIQALDGNPCVCSHKHPLRLIWGGAGRDSGKVVIRDLDLSCAVCPWRSCVVRLKGFFFFGLCMCVGTYNIVYVYCVLYTRLQMFLLVTNIGNGCCVYLLFARYAPLDYFCHKKWAYPWQCHSTVPLCVSVRLSPIYSEPAGRANI